MFISEAGVILKNEENGLAKEIHCYIANFFISSSNQLPQAELTDICEIKKVIVYLGFLTKDIILIV